MKNTGVKLFVAGLLLVVLTLHIDSPWSYGFEIIKDGGIRENLEVVLLQHLVGNYVRIDIFFDPLGYLLMFVGANSLPAGGKFLHNVKVFSMIGAFAYLGKLGLPLAISQNEVLGWVLVCTALEVASQLICMYSFMLACKKQVDNYKHMELGKDLAFAVELYGFAVVLGFFAGALVLCQFFFAKLIYGILAFLAAFAVLYYAWKVLAYTKRLGLFCTGAGGENATEGAEWLPR